MRSVSMIMLLGFAVSGSVGISAQTPTNMVDQIVDQVSAAYKVDQLNRASTIRLEEERRHEYPDHEYGPDFHDLSAQRQHHVLDFNNQSGSSEYLTSIAGSNWHGRSVLKNGKSRFIIYAPQFLQNEVEEDFAVEYGRIIRSSGALLARELVNAKGTAQYDGEEMWLGKMHDKLTFEMASSPPLTIFVGKDTGYISYMVRTVGENIKVAYTFDHHMLQDGIPVAREHSFYANGERVFYSFDRKLVINDQRDNNAFEIDAGIIPEPERVDQSSMTVESIAEGIHHAGQDENYSTFFSTNDGVIAFGIGAGFGDRLKAYREQTAITLPLTHAIVADHHRGKMAGAGDAAAEGAILLTTQDAAPRVKAMLAEANPDARVEAVEKRSDFGGLAILNVATAHASRNLVAYHAPSATFAQIGHFNNPYKSEAGFTDYTAVTLNDALVPFALTPKTILSAESRKADTWTAFQNAMKAYDPTPCHRDRAICSN